MPDLSHIHRHFTELVISPITNQLTGLFDLSGRVGVVFLLCSYAIAYALFRFRRQRGLTQATSFWQFIGGARVNLHRSALLDYRYYLVRGILNVALMVPIVGIIDPYILRSGDYIAFFTHLWGARPQVGENLGLSLLYGLGVFLVSDFKNYWVHRAFHSRWLWAFHKVHHSAAVLTPITASRVHFVEKLAANLAGTVLLGVYAGIFWYACGGQISAYTLFGVTYMILLFNVLATNLRHSHVWLSFGPLVEHVINSPAQHQIHHSDAPRHFNRNFGINLSLWDWMFGTLYVTQRAPEPIQFGAGEHDDARYSSLWSLIVTPFVETVRKVTMARNQRVRPSDRPARNRHR
ncbi:sterol desaturase family protein [Pseudomonas nicosulfuronedens]|uniref:Sterol desaturase family protein n=1 Tax=Pseudomonas nicosulfuronedens TaxID=2571105 RepID=A0A5R9QKS1_9PSED|nr:sterol desaturase family protein [Pseudomonas nicosulfuronedens]MDH1012939.1 sterol desaturase family protein [Pseudomonas nicosulfuronedens]MDH1982203.1 sterol desaturase family protein [Pseudomonas nicosulfuronedens]MDH2030684.1 sterol desaturase family protein [Pseudomonas nicosulfuronedens]TLX69855.1 sterol desaturase family protein [Pseudomonas nicosulfuronedens]